MIVEMVPAMWKSCRAVEHSLRQFSSNLLRPAFAAVLMAVAAVDAEEETAFAEPLRINEFKYLTTTCTVKKKNKCCYGT